jgi:hypothetical protein
MSDRHLSDKMLAPSSAEPTRITSTNLLQFMDISIAIPISWNESGTRYTCNFIHNTLEHNIYNALNM